LRNIAHHPIPPDVASQTTFRLFYALALLGCGHARWPDEPGTPVELSISQNVDAGDRFLTALTARRQAASLSPPVTVPRYQQEISAYAADLQAGKTSATAAERAIETWGKSRYAADVAGFLVDCSAAENMAIPSRLIELPTAVISYAVAYFRPRSLAQNQCAILVVAVVGPQSVKAVSAN
jgi:hypothetical protein